MQSRSSSTVHTWLNLSQWRTAPVSALILSKWTRYSVHVSVWITWCPTGCPLSPHSDTLLLRVYAAPPDEVYNNFRSNHVPNCFVHTVPTMVILLLPFPSPQIHPLLLYLSTISPFAFHPSFNQLVLSTNLSILAKNFFPPCSLFSPSLSVKTNIINHLSILLRGHWPETIIVCMYHCLCIHACICACMHACAHACVCMRMCLPSTIIVCKCVCAPMHVSVHVCMLMHTIMYVCVWMRICLPSYLLPDLLSISGMFGFHY